ncbi:TetR/AcrR family transcriptional regulator [Pseudonocardia acaciae]|uniref:TetR/AcrR family transcriptional regulator n=1 Tax=Pseudonocardia acaciae TaxID=551276 RepID=UPI00048AFCF3|nr:TetR/AcrR family transcriptional regulator [Pseudonocardia acaciae]
MTETDTAARRRGRRPAGEDTRGALLAAARTEFAERGYQGARVRSIAAAAGVDAAMVNHWFGGKNGLFVAALDLPVNPEIILTRVLEGDPDTAGERIVRNFIAVWDASGGGAFAALLRSVATHEAAARMMREFVVNVIFRRLTHALGPDQPELRACLCGSQMVGLGMARYVVKLDPLSTADADTLAAAIGPNLQRYLTGPLG